MYNKRDDEPFKFHARISTGWRALGKLDGKMKRRALVKSPCVWASDVIQNFFCAGTQKNARATLSENKRLLPVI